MAPLLRSAFANNKTILTAEFPLGRDYRVLDAIAVGEAPYGFQSIDGVGRLAIRANSPNVTALRVSLRRY